jgi:hypothetical protein
MQYRTIENAEDILQEIASNESKMQFFRNISERNGVQCACDGMRAAVILPEGSADWDLQDAYFDTGDEVIPKFEFTRLFTARRNNGLHLKIVKREAKALIEFLNKYEKNFTQPYSVYLYAPLMKIIKEEELAEYDGEKIIMFNGKFLKDALDFIVCSSNDYIEIYYNGKDDGMIMKSGRLYIFVLPLRQQAA